MPPDSVRGHPSPLGPRRRVHYIPPAHRPPDARHPLLPARQRQEAGEAACHTIEREGKHVFRIRPLLIGATALAALLTAPSAYASVLRHAPNHKLSHSASTNWSGYAVSGFGQYTSVSASWTQPAVDCGMTPNAY